jgi:demethylmenaquinone methyltransferase/2-methoxy-6-polyprenyl-1,4-benzoquinol methylase
LREAGGPTARDAAPGGLPPFDCLWCGQAWRPRDANDLEALARLCPDCLGRAGSNEFLRFRLRAALDARARAHAATPTDPVAVAPPATPTHEDELVPYYEARAAEYDEWYLRRGRYSHGLVQDMAWEMELAVASTWLDGLPLGGEIVELAAGTGWWTALLAAKGELHAYDAAGAPLDRARARLVAHGLQAHLHVRDAWAAPDREVDALFSGFWLSHVPRPRLADFLGIARAWLRPGGVYAAIDSQPDAASGTVDRLPVPAPDLARRRLADGREFTIPKVHYRADELTEALRTAGFVDVEVGSSGRFFLLVRAIAA